MTGRFDFLDAFPMGAGSYRIFRSEYNRLYRRYLEERSHGRSEDAALTAYEMVCVHSQMRRIERLVEDYDWADEAERQLEYDDEDIRLLQVIRYRIIKGLSVEETAEVMGISRSTAYRLIARAERGTSKSAQKNGGA